MDDIEIKKLDFTCPPAQNKTICRLYLLIFVLSLISSLIFDCLWTFLLKFHMCVENLIIYNSPFWVSILLAFYSKYQNYHNGYISKFDVHGCLNDLVFWYHRKLLATLFKVLNKYPIWDNEFLCSIIFE